MHRDHARGTHSVKLVCLDRSIDHHSPPGCDASPVALLEGGVLPVSLSRLMQRVYWRVDNWLRLITTRSSEVSDWKRRSFQPSLWRTSKPMLASGVSGWYPVKRLWAYRVRVRAAASSSELCGSRVHPHPQPFPPSCFKTTNPIRTWRV